MAILKPFERLRPADLSAIEDFRGRGPFLGQAVDRGVERPFRGGCGPFAALALAALSGVLGPRIEALPASLWFVLSGGLAVWALLGLGRNFIAVARSRQLMQQDAGWHSLTWTQEGLCYLSWEDCVLASWVEIEDLRWFDDTAMPGLADSIWVHIKGGGKAVIFPRDGGFAGESLEQWFTRIAGPWHKATGRTAVRESRDVPEGAQKGS